MALLLDTHAFLWFASGDVQLPIPLRAQIEDASQPCFLSAVSLWEITIKVQIGKLKLKLSLQELFDYADRNQMEILPIAYDHLLALSTLPDHHADPFDRLIVAQAIAEDLLLVSRDKNIRKYKVRHQWG